MAGGDNMNDPRDDKDGVFAYGLLAIACGLAAACLLTLWAMGA